MTDVRSRLARCFAAVFPDLPPDQVERASPETVPAWDSLATVTLVSVVEDEFGIQIPFEDPEWTASFEAMLTNVENAVQAA